MLTMLRRATQVSLRNDISFRLTAAAQCTSVTDGQTDGQTDGSRSARKKLKKRTSYEDNPSRQPPVSERRAGDWERKTRQDDDTQEKTTGGTTVGEISIQCDRALLYVLLSH